MTMDGPTNLFADIPADPPEGRMLLQVIPEGRNDRWNLASTFIDHWIRPMGESDRVSCDRLDAAEQRLGLRLPIALREW